MLRDRVRPPVGLVLGTPAEAAHLVDAGDTAEAVGSGDVPVLATPRLIGWFEAVTVAAVGRLDEGTRTTVGTKVEVDHLIASPVGARVNVRAELAHVDGRLLRFEVVWVNTVGTRRPRLDRYTLQRGVEKLRGWIRGRRSATLSSGSATPAPIVLDPPMWPGHTRRWQRRFNRSRITRAVRRLPPTATETIGMTTLPTSADLIDAGIARRWVYYCVDDLSEWPGLDGPALAAMEVEAAKARARAARRYRGAPGPASS